MMQKVRLMMFSLNMVDYSMSFLLLSTWVFCWTSRGDRSEPFLLFDFWCGTLPSSLKVIGWGGGGGLWDFSVSPRPLGFGFFGFRVLGLRVWGLGLTIKIKSFHNLLQCCNARLIMPLELEKTSDKLRNCSTVGRDWVVITSVASRPPRTRNQTRSPDSKGIVLSWDNTNTSTESHNKFAFLLEGRRYYYILNYKRLCPCVCK